MRKFKGKERINTLLNIDSVFGEYEGHVMPIILTIALAGAPLLIWLFLLQGTPIKFTWVCIFDVLWTGRWALKILGKEDVKTKFYLEQRQSKGATADEIVHVKGISNDGLIQYDNGVIAYIVSGYLRSYLTDDKLSVDLENFMNELDNWYWDYYLHNTMDELLCENDLPKLKRYTDEDVIHERIDFYSYQDEWARNHTGLYRISFLVYTSSYNYNKMKSHLNELVTSEVAQVFNEVEVLDYDGVADLCSRDIVAFADIRKMLLRKYDNNQFYASKVLWYDDEVPQELAKPQEVSDMSERRL